LKSERNIADRIIEEFMITANETVARHLFQWDVPSLYRIHELPDPQKVFEFDEIALSFGYRLGIGSGERAVGKPPRIKDRLQRGRRRRTNRPEAMAVQGANLKIHSRDYQRLIDQIAGKPEERILSYLMLRSLKQAIYSPQNKGHFGLASHCYTHFTSPIRRYPDLIVHRILKVLLNSSEVEQPGYRPARPTQQKLLYSFQVEGQDPENLESHKTRRKTRQRRAESFAEEAPVGNPSLYDNEGLDAIARHSSETERRADDSERELIDLKKLEFMADKLGDEFEGIVIHIIKEGMFVELLDLFVEGFVNINSLEDDDYRFRDRPICLAGRRSGNSFRLGDRLIVAVDRIDRFRRRVDLSVARKVLPNNLPL
jgi:ribonuclease R